MGALIDTLSDYMSALDDARVRVTMDPRNVNPPCVLLVPPSIDIDALCGGTADFVAYAITRGPATLDAWRSLDDLATRCAAVLPIESVRPSQYALDDTSALPALELSWQLVISWP